MKKAKETNLQKNKRRIRYKLKSLNKDKLRLSVFKSSNNIYVQLIDDLNSKTIVSSSSLQLESKSKSFGSNVDSAKKVGEDMSKKIKSLKLKQKIYVDRSGYKYHGRVKALFDSINEVINN